MCCFSWSFFLVVLVVVVLLVVCVDLLYKYLYYLYVLSDLCVVWWLIEYWLGDVWVIVDEDVVIIDIDEVIGVIKYVVIDDGKDFYDYLLVDG